MKPRPIIVVGNGGHALVVIEVLRLNHREILGIVDSAKQSPSVVPGIPVLGSDEALTSFSPTDISLANGIGQIRSNNPRRRVFDMLSAKGFCFESIYHPSAIIAEDCIVGEGTQFMAGSIVQPGARLGRNAIVNTRSTIDHGCVVEDHCHIAPGAVLCGDVTVGEASHIGAGAVIIEGKRIGRGVTVGAGAVVVTDVPDGETVIGVPAHRQID